MSAPGTAQPKPEAPTQDLWQIAEVGDLDQLQKILARGADVNACNGSGVTPLMVAAYHGRREVVRALVEHGAELNAVDSGGLTAAMLADDAGHEEIVRILVALGVKRGPAQPASESSPVRFTQKEPFAAKTDHDVAPAGRDPKVRTLHEPPEIWDLVHETQAEFKPASAVVARLKALRPLALAAILLIIGGGAVFWFMRSRDSSVSPIVTPPVQAESINTRNVSSPHPAESNKTAPSSDQPFDSTPARTATAVTSIDEPKPDIAASAASSGSGVAARPRRQNPTSSATKSATVTAPRNQDRTQTLGMFENAVPNVARTDTKTAGQASTTPASKSDKEKSANPTANRKEADRSLSPQLIAPAKAGPTPKAKVIPWPNE